MKTPHSTRPAAILAMLLAASLAACDDSGKTAGQKVDAAVASTERKADEIKADITKGASEVKDLATKAAADAKQFATDTTITAGVKAELAKDPGLSATRIDVDTRDGRVALGGTAPDASARDRATKLAMSVGGVVSVDNQLSVH